MRASIKKLTGVLQSLGMDQPGGLTGNLDFSCKGWGEPVRRWQPSDR